MAKKELSTESTDISTSGLVKIKAIKLMNPIQINMKLSSYIDITQPEHRDTKIAWNSDGKYFRIYHPSMQKGDMHLNQDNVIEWYLG